MAKPGAGSTALKPEIGFFGSSFIAFNGLVGAGIFALPAVLADAFGSFSPWLFPVFGALMLLVAGPLAQLAARFTATGGPIAYANAAFGPAAAFQVGWIYYLGRVAAIAANSNVFVAYAAMFWPPLADGPMRAATLVLLIGGLAAVNVLGLRRAVRLLDALTLLKALPLVLLAIGGLALYGGELQMPAALPVFSDVEASALVILYAFVGFEGLLIPAAETKDARRTIPRAMLLTITGTAVLYFIVQLAYVAVMPAASGGDAPLVAMGTAIAGGIGAAVITLTALASLSGNLTSAMISTSRVSFALAEEGSLPRWFGRVSARFRTPANSVLFMGAISLGLAVTGSFVWLAVIGTLARMIVYVVSLAALPRIRMQAGERAMPSAVSAAALAGGFALCGWAMLQSDWPTWRTLGILALIGSGLYIAARRSAVRT